EERMALNLGLRVGCAALFGFWILSLAGATASAVPSEHEQDTWVSLLATPLERDEILRGKMLGPLRASAPIGAALGALWVLGLVAGAVHPLGLLCASAMAGVLIWFALALGMFAGVKSKVSWRARAWAQGIVVVTHLCCVMPALSASVMMGLALWSYAEVYEAF